MPFSQKAMCWLAMLTQASSFYNGPKSHYLWSYSMSVVLIAFRYFNFSKSISIDNERAKTWVLSIVVSSQKNFNLRWEENDQFKIIFWGPFVALHVEKEVSNCIKDFDPLKNTNRTGPINFSIADRVLIWRFNRPSIIGCAICLPEISNRGCNLFTTGN